MAVHVKCNFISIQQLVVKFSSQAVTDRHSSSTKATPPIIPTSRQNYYAPHCRGGLSDTAMQSVYLPVCPSLGYRL